MKISPKKVFLSLSLLILILQSSKAQFKLGVQAGWNSSGASISDLKKTNNISAPKFGIITEINLFPGLLFRPAINFQQTGFTNNETSTYINGATTGIQYENNKFSINNLEIPLELTIPLRLGKGRLLLSAAPTATIAINGTNNFDNYAETNTGNIITGTQVRGNTDLKFGNLTGELKKVDWGTRFGIGYAFSKGLQLNATYNIGVSDINNENTSTHKTHSIGIALGYFFIK